MPFNQMGQYDYDYEFDDQEDFGFANLEEDYEEPENEEVSSKKVFQCSPQNHKFTRKTLLISCYQECANCGYSPELDKDKLDFLECHKNYLDWTSRR